MNAPDDAALLRRFVHQADETAFRTLVERHLPLVHASATRQLGGDTHLAEDVAQKVFALLAARGKRLLDHPTLAGWLFTTTRNLAHAAQRSRARRVFHENRSAMSSEPTPPREHEPSWAEFTPVLDQALADLGDRDREGVLLRFFENRSYAEIGSYFGLSENAARMRVERSLEKLRGLLLSRGVAATSVSLAGSLAAHGAPAIAADIATRIAAQALTTTASAGALGGAVGGVVDFMSKAKIATAVSVLAIGVAVYEGAVIQTQSRRMQESERRAQAALDQLALERVALASATQRLQAADDDNARLLSAITRASQGLGEVATKSGGAEKYSRADVMKRFEHAQQLALQKDYEAALKEYLWCFDVGMVGFGFIVERRERLPDKLRELLQMYPAAGALLRQRRTETLEQMLADRQDTEAVAEFMALSRALSDPSAVVDAMNRLPAGDSRKDAFLVGDAYNLLIEQRNYGAIAAVRTYEKMASSIDMNSALIKSPAIDPKVLPQYREGFIKFAASDVEVLLGAGRQEEARQLAAKLLAFDSSATTRAQLLERAKRAGKPDWRLP